MFQKLLLSANALRRHQEGPLAQERERYIQNCADSGATYWSLRIKCNELLWAAKLIGSNGTQVFDSEALVRLADRRVSYHNSSTTRVRFTNVTRPWLRFLGWWTEPVETYPFQDQLDQYCLWMRNERGFSETTIAGWRCRVRDFLIWCDMHGLGLGKLIPSDIDDYFMDEDAHHWGRITVANIATILRVFLRYGTSQGWYQSQLAETIRSPRIYAQETLPYAPGWDDVQRILAAGAHSELANEVRDRAILMLLSIYGMRATEVTTLRLDQIDWRRRVIRVFRLKRRQPQEYPLVASVAQALAHYVDHVRPKKPFPEVFLSVHAPVRPMTRAAIYKIVNKKFTALGIEVAHRGPHALRHACATRLINQGSTLKEIGNHLGHQTMQATRIYAKVDMVALRQIGDFDLGDLP